MLSTLSPLHPLVSPFRRGWATHAWVRLLAVLSFGLAVTVLFGWLFPGSLRWPIGPDFHNYYEPVARSIMSGNGFHLPDGQAAILYPPGYPLALAAIFTLARALGIAEAALVVPVNGLAVGLACMSLFWMLEQALGRSRAFVAVAVFATYPFMLYLAQMPSSEILFAVPFFWALALLMRLAWAGSRSMARFFGVGLLLGISMLIRPIAIGTGIVAAGLLIFVLMRSLAVSVRLRLAAAVLLGNLVAILPWTLWTWSATGQIAPLGTNGLASATDGLTFGLSDADRRSSPVHVPSDVEAVMRNVHAHTAEFHTMPQLASYMLSELRRDPAAVIKLAAIKARRSWYGKDNGRLESLSAGIQAVYLAGIVFCSFVAARRRALERQIVIVVWTLACYFWLASAAVLPLLRYMVPAMGILSLAVAAGFPQRHPSVAEARSQDAT